MTSIAISPALTDLNRGIRAQLLPSDTTLSATQSQPDTTAAEPEPKLCCGDDDRLHFLREVFGDQERMADAFTQFAEALIPHLARLAMEQPSVVSWDFDLRNDDGQLRVIDTEMTCDEIAWLESRLNAHPSLSELAARFNESVVGAYGDVDHPYYMVETGSGGGLEPAIPGLADTVDGDVKFMSLLRTVRDADCGQGIRGDYFRAHRYELAATKVRDFIMLPGTYRKTAADGVELATTSQPSTGAWKA